MLLDAMRYPLSRGAFSPGIKLVRSSERRPSGATVRVAVPNGLPESLRYVKAICAGVAGSGFTTLMRLRYELPGVELELN